MEQDDCLSALAEFKQLEQITLPHRALSDVLCGPSRCPESHWDRHSCPKLQEERRIAESAAGMLATECHALSYISFERGLKASIVRDADGRMERLLWSYEPSKLTFIPSDDITWPNIPKHDDSYVEQLAW